MPIFSGQRIARIPTPLEVQYTLDASGQICGQFLWCCLHPVWTLPFTFACFCASRLVWIRPDNFQTPWTKRGRKITALHHVWYPNYSHDKHCRKLVRQVNAERDAGCTTRRVWQREDGHLPVCILTLNNLDVNWSLTPKTWSGSASKT